MKRTALFCVLILCFSAIVGLAEDDESEKTAIKKAIEDLYFKGQKYHDREALSKIFHESGHLHAVLTDGTFWTMPAPEWIARKDPNKKVSESGFFIDEIRVTGTSASVTARQDTGTWVVVDYLNMLKIDGEWRIVSKIFYSKKK